MTEYPRSVLDARRIQEPAAPASLPSVPPTPCGHEWDFLRSTDGHDLFYCRRCLVYRRVRQPTP